MTQKRLIAPTEGFTYPTPVKSKFKRGDKVRATVKTTHANFIFHRHSLEKGKRHGVRRFIAVPQRVGIVQEVTTGLDRRIIMIHISYGDCLVKLNQEKVVAA